MEEHIRQRVVKREETGGNDPENGSPDGGGGGKCGHHINFMTHKSNMTMVTKYKLNIDYF